MIEIPFVDQNDFVLEATLDDVTYFLHLQWNSEAEIWVMGIEDINAVNLFNGAVLLPNIPLLAQFRTLPVPTGEFIVATSDPLQVIDRESFLNGRAHLWYVTGDEMYAL